MKNVKIKESEPLILLEIIEYELNSVVIKTIIKKTTGNVSVLALDVGEALVERISPFDSFAQIIDGRAEININEIPHLMETGQSIIIPAHTPNKIIANERFKMILTVIKSGYE